MDDYINFIEYLRKKLNKKDFRYFFIHEFIFKKLDINGYTIFNHYRDIKLCDICLKFYSVYNYLQNNLFECCPSCDIDENIYLPLYVVLDSRRHKYKKLIKKLEVHMKNCDFKSKLLSKLFDVLNLNDKILGLNPLKSCISCHHVFEDHVIFTSKLCSNCQHMDVYYNKLECRCSYSLKNIAINAIRENNINVNNIPKLLLKSKCEYIK